MTDKSGNLIWTQTYEMTSPAIAVSDPYVAVGDIGANTIYIFNEYGQLGRINTDVPIQEIRISAQGVIAAVLSDSATNYINLYDKQGKFSEASKHLFRTQATLGQRVIFRCDTLIGKLSLHGWQHCENQSDFVQFQ